MENHSQPPPKIITELLEKAHQGDKAARNELFEIVHPILDRMARKMLRSGDRAAGLIRPSDLLNEAIYRIINPKPDLQGASGDDETAKITEEDELDFYDPRPLLEKYRFENRAKFFAFVSKLMRHLITDRIRSAYGRKGGERVFVSLDGAGALSVNPSIDWLAFDEALTLLEKEDESAAHIVELRSMWGLTIEETASALEISPATVKRDFRYGKAFVAKKLSSQKKP